MAFKAGDLAVCANIPPMAGCGHIDKYVHNMMAGTVVQLKECIDREQGKFWIFENPVVLFDANGDPEIDVTGTLEQALEPYPRASYFLLGE